MSGEIQAQDKKLPLCLIYATCQGGYLANVLRKSEAFTAQFSLHNYSNYYGPGIVATVAPFDLEMLKRCSLFIYHKVNAPEGRALLATMFQLLPKDCLKIPLPYVTANLYWPLHYDKCSPIGVDEKYTFGVLPYRSLTLDLLIEKGLPEQEIINIYSSLAPEQFEDLEALRERTFTAWETLDREGEGHIRVADFLRGNWQRQLLFYMCNHPSRAVFLHIANQILHNLSIAPLSPHEVRTSSCGQASTYAIHPNVAKYYGLSFVKESAQFTYLGKLHSFDSFIRFYIQEARKKGLLPLVA